MKPTQILPGVRKNLLAATTALMASAMVVPAFAQATAPAPAPQEPLPVPAPQATPAPPKQGPTEGPASVADLAEGLLDSVVNISTSQTVKGTEGPGAVPMPQLPEGSPFQDFFDDFFKDRGGPGGPGGGSQKVQSLGSGFVVDAEEESSSPTIT